MFSVSLAIVEACEQCNKNFSLDEQYLACLIECVVCGSADAISVSRPKIARILSDYPALTARLRDSKRIDTNGNVAWATDIDRVQRVLLKLARGHIAYELSLPKLEEPEQLSIAPLIALSNEQRSVFESPHNEVMTLWPEIGSRAFIRASKEWPFAPDSEWIVVQPGRYRYMVSQADGNAVQIVLSEYLACRVVWH